MTSKKVYDYTISDDLSTLEYATISYGYDSTWKDKLISYNGQEITYDEIGNPLSYLGNTMTWTGRNLRKVVTDDATIKYVYNASGVRTKKTVGSEESNYYYSNGQLAYEKRGNKELYYSYDQDGTIAAICYVKEDGTVATYYPAVNSRGDVEALYNYKGELVAEYCYDSWGKVISIKNASGNEITTETHIGLVNPIRYRGYYYDAETGFYYLNSRYYDPEVGRFINADEQLNKDVLGCNLYAYCGNNPVTRSDEKGGSWQFSFVCAVIGGVVGFTSKVIANKLTGKKWNEGVVGATVGGIVGGAVFGATYNHTVAASAAAAIAGAFAQSATNEIGKYCSPIGKANGQSTTQKVTSTNITTSIANVGYETVINGGISILTGSAAEVIIPSISATNDIKSITASLFDDFAKKTHKQTVLQGVFDMEVDMVQNIGESLSAGQIQQSGMIMLYAKD